MSIFSIRPMSLSDVAQAVDLQREAFPPPFSDDLHWDPAHLCHHIEVFPEGQFVAEIDGGVVGSCSNAIIPEDRWQAHASWGETLGGPYIRRHDASGSTLYGLDITVHPKARRIGIGRAFYQMRFALVEQLSLVRYGTGCRLPDYRVYEEAHPLVSVAEYAGIVVAGRAVDRTLTPLLRYGLAFLGVIENYMEDVESANAAALLERER